MQKKQERNIVRITRNLLRNFAFQQRVKEADVHFTRKRKLSIEQVITFILNRPAITLYAEVKRVFGEMQGIQVTKDALLKARKKIHFCGFQEIFDISVRECLEYDPSDPFCAQFLLNGYRVFAIDGTDLRLEGSKELKAYFGVSKTQPNRAWARASILCEVTTGVVVDACLESHTVDERTLAKRHLENFEQYKGKRDILLFDRGYPSKALLAELSERGLFYVMRVSTSFSQEIDFLTEPEGEVSITVGRNTYPQRVIRLPLPSGETEVLLTNLPRETFAHDAFLSMYHLRWNIESKYNTLKNKLQMVHFSGRTVNSVKQDFYAAMYLSNLVTAIRCTAQDELDSREEGKDYKSAHRVNENALIGRLKDKLIIAIAHENDDTRDMLLESIKDEASRCYYNVRPTRPVPPRKSRETHHKQSVPVKRAF